LSISNPCSHVESISICFHKCNLLLLTAKWLVRIQEQLVPINSFPLTAKWLVRIQEQLVPVNSLLLSVKWLVWIQEQLVPVLFVSVISQEASSNTRAACAYLPVSILGQVPSSSQKNKLVPVDLLFVSPINLVICYLVDVYQSRNGYDIPCYLLSC